MKILKSLSLALILTLGCTSEYSAIHPDLTRVVVDSLIQPYPIDELDVAIVLDRSGSMYDDETAVGVGMELLKTDIDGVIPDYQFGFITADSAQTGFVGPFDQNSSSIDILLAPTLLPHAQGEEGFAALYTFASGDTEFLRDSADLLVFFISDEEEQSSLTPEITKEWLLDFKAGNQIDVVSITATTEECSSFGTGSKYMKISQLFGKPAIDLCSDSWEDWLSESSFLINLQGHLELSEVPISQSLAVYVDGVGTYEWHYEEAANVIYFDFDLEHGSLIEVGYKVIDDSA